MKHDEEVGSWWIGPFPYAHPNSGCTLEFEGVPEAATVGDIEELTPEYPLLHSYNFANGSWNATFMDPASTFNALVTMLKLANNRPDEHPTKGSTKLLDATVTVSIRGAATGRPSTKSRRAPAVATTNPPAVPASTYKTNFPPGFMADMPSITVGKVPVQRIPVAAGHPTPASKSPVASGCTRYTNSPYNPVQCTTPASSSNGSPVVGKIAPARQTSSTLNWADLDDDSDEEVVPAVVVVPQTAAAPAPTRPTAARKVASLLVPIGEDPDDASCSPGASGEVIGASVANQPVRGQATHTKAASKKGKKAKKAASLVAASPAANKAASLRAGFGGSSAVSKDDSASADARVHPSTPDVAKKELAGYSLKGYNLTRTLGGGRGIPTPFSLSGRNVIDMMEMMQMMYSMPSGGFDEVPSSATSRNGWGRNGKPNAKASPYTGTQKAEGTVAAVPSVAPAVAAAPQEAETIACEKQAKGPILLAALGADIDVKEANQRIAAATCGSHIPPKKGSLELSTEGGHSDSTGSVTPSDEVPTVAVAEVRSGWVAIAAAAPIPRKAAPAAAVEAAKDEAAAVRRNRQKKERKPRDPNNAPKEKSEDVVKVVPVSDSPTERRQKGSFLSAALRV